MARRPAARPGVDRDGEAAPSGPDPAELDALDALPGSGGTWDVFGRKLRVTNLDKGIFPGRDGEEPVTKRELIRLRGPDRADRAALPRRAGPLNMHRFPGGADTKGFWHKELPAHAPDWLPRWDNPDADRGETTTYLVVDEPAALVWAANFGALEWHAWTLARTSRPTSRPTRSSTSTRARPPAGTTCWRWPGCTAPPSSTWACGRGPS